MSKRKPSQKKTSPKAGNQPKAAKASPSPASQGGATISACMMVKNEEKNLPRALKSIKPWVDEIIVVDTGSTDRTVEIAESFGAKVYHHPWENSFSKHRNQSISYATGDWLLIIDADEELEQESAKQLRKLTTAPPEVHCFLFELLNEVSAGGETFVLHPRMFRNGTGFHYEGTVHNKPIVYGQVVRTTVKLKHWGYNESPEVMEAKHKRRTEMIRAWIEKEPDNFLAHSYLAHALISRPECLSEAVEQSMEALRLLRLTPGEDQRYPHVYYPILNGLTNLGRDDELMQRGQDCLQISPHYPDPLFFMAWVAYKRQNWEDVCQYAARYLELQDHCRANPQDYVYFENMTFDQLNAILMRWVVAAGRLGKADEAKKAMSLVLQERGAEEASRGAVLTLINAGHADLGLELAQLVNQGKPEWSWPGKVLSMSTIKQQETQAANLVKQAEEALQQGRGQEALDQLKSAAQMSPHSPEVLLNLAKALEQTGRPAEAEAELIKGLNAHPGHAWAWQRLADSCLAREDYVGAAACLRRYLKQAPADEDAKGKLKSCMEVQAPLSVAQKPPRLVVFLVGGLTPELVRMPAPHLLIGSAWGEFLADGEPQPDAANWASLFTGAPASVHGLTEEAGFDQPLSVDSLKVPAFWEVLGSEITVGLAASPLTTPPPKVNGWALGGFPGGLLSPGLVHPPELAPRVLATGFRTDFALNEYELQTAPQRIDNDIRQEGLLLQNERSKMIAAAALPAVDVLLIGFTALEYMQKARELATYQMYSAYQQVYGWIETFLAGVQPESFAIFSQRGYQRQGSIASRGGFYCMSWLRGENGKANLTDVAGELVRFMGGDSGGLGQPKT
jgi:glycosyltransferase involved in cell wall biosynthesis/thioredoxin-like negative regulator of GroEL